MSAHDYSKKDFQNDYTVDGSVSEDDFLDRALEDTFDYKLIQKIKQNPCLFNNKRKETKDEKSRIWKQIAEDLHETDESCQKRWKRLREYFAKERIKRSENSASSYKWPLYDAMFFIDPYVIRKKSFANKKVNATKLPSTCTPQTSTPQQVQHPYETIETELPSLLNENSAFSSDHEDSMHNITNEVVNSEVIESVNECQNQIREKASNSSNTKISTPPRSPLQDITAHLNNQISTPPRSPLQDIAAHLNNQISTPPRSPVHNNNSSPPNKTDSSNIKTSTYRSSLHDITASSNSHKNINAAQDLNSTKKYYKDAENDAIAELVTKRLQKIEEEKKKNKLIRTIMDILFE